MIKPATIKSCIRAAHGVLAGVAAVAAAGALGIGLGACEKNTNSVSEAHGAATGGYSINPARATLGADDTTLILTVNGGEPPFRWTVSDEALGTLPHGADKRTITYSRASGALGANTIEVTDNNGDRTQAIITQADVTELAIDPTSAEVAIGATFVFQRTGGVAPFTWSVLTPANGTVDGSASSQGVYTQLGPGDNQVLLTDGQGHTVVADVTAASGSVLAVDPSSGTAGSDGSLIQFTATGGVPPYTWTVSDGALGKFLNGNTGAAIVYERTTPNPGDNTITVTDGQGSTATAIISQP